MNEALIERLRISCLGLDAVDPLRLLVDDVIAELESQEPVATVSRNQDESLTFMPLYDFYVTNGMKLYAAPQQRTEPVSDDIASIIACRDMLDAQPIPNLKGETK